jgi:solute carrier family 25 protein 44
MAANTAVDWERLDKQQFFVYGAGIFTGLTAALFPLSVIKTRMMALEGAPRGLSGAVATARTVVHHDGVRGLYKGFGTVLCGLIPGRMLYLGTLEASKSAVLAALQRHNLASDTAAAGVASFVGGGLGSLAGQLVVVPIDVVSQRLMLMGGGPASAGAAPAAPRRVTGLQLTREILRQEGLRGMYRGFGASVATFVPSSAIWWASYGAWQAAIWHQVDRLQGGPAPGGAPRQRGEGELLGVQAVAGVVTGCTSAVLTNPLDVVKTRLQTRAADGAGARPSWAGVARQLLAADGPAGFYRGVAPRMVSTSLWGTCMVTTYEFLKRLCSVPPPPPEAGGAKGARRRGEGGDEDALVNAVPGRAR